MLVKSGADIARKLAEMGHFAAREAEAAGENNRSFGHAADKKNHLFYRTLAIAYFAFSETAFVGGSLQVVRQSLHATRGFDVQMSRLYERALDLVVQKDICVIPLSDLVPAPYKLP